MCRQMGNGEDRNTEGMPGTTYENYDWLLRFIWDNVLLIVITLRFLHETNRKLYWMRKYYSHRLDVEKGFTDFIDENARKRFLPLFFTDHTPCGSYYNEAMTETKGIL